MCFSPRFWWGQSCSAWPWWGRWNGSCPAWRGQATCVCRLASCWLRQWGCSPLVGLGRTQAGCWCLGGRQKSKTCNTNVTIRLQFLGFLFFVVFTISSKKIIIKDWFFWQIYRIPEKHEFPRKPKNNMGGERAEGGGGKANRVKISPPPLLLMFNPTYNPLSPSQHHLTVRATETRNEHNPPYPPLLTAMETDRQTDRDTQREYIKLPEEFLGLHSYTFFICICRNQHTTPRGSWEDPGVSCLPSWPAPAPQCWQTPVKRWSPRSACPPRWTGCWVPAPDRWAAPVSQNRHHWKYTHIQHMHACTHTHTRTHARTHTYTHTQKHTHIIIYI